VLGLRRLGLALTIAGGLAALSAQAAAEAAGPLAQIAGLAGEWIAAEDGDMVRKGDLVARYRVTAGGTAVVETLFPGAAHEMVTVYYADRGDLVLTHYCAGGNQPRMRAKAAPGASRFEFAFDGGTNLDAAVDRHMHSAWMELVSADELRSEWTEHAGGREGMVVRTHLVRRSQSPGSALPGQ
jgi:hypothetical protein